MLLSRRAAALALGTSAATFVLPERAFGTTALALSLEDLVKASARVVVGTPVEHSSDYAIVRGAKRIVTWTRVLQDQDLLKDEDGKDEILVMTMGGKIGSLRQKVHGEAALRTGERCVLFVSEEHELTRRVLGMAQGHYPLSPSASGGVLRRSPQLPHLLGSRPDKGPQKARAAIDALHDQPLDQARALIRQAR